MASSGQPPTFYHILMNPSAPHLPLPLKFVKKHLKNRILKKPILKSANGGYSWKLKMKKFDDDDDDSFCFVDGWCKVVKDVGFLFGEFLLFRYVGNSVFLMHVYSVNGCEKILAPRISSKFKVVDDEVSVFDDDEVSVFDDDEVEDEDDDYDDEDDDEVELGDDDDDEDEDDGEDENEDDVDIDGDDGDPFFVITSSKRNRNKLRIPPDLVPIANIKTKETITLKNDDGYEKQMSVRSYTQNNLTRYYVAEGWKEFQQSNNISEGDECVLKFITSEDKLCLAKVTKKRTRATEADNDDIFDDEGKAENAKHVNEDDDSNVDGDDIFDDDVDDEGEAENAEFVNDDEDHEDDDHNVNGDDEDPSFILTSTKKNRYHLWFKADFVALAKIHTKKTITLKNVDGYEKELRLRSNKRKRSIRYFLNAGWNEFQQNSNISEGDQFLFKFIRSENKFCVEKITENITRASPLPPAVEAPLTEVDDPLTEDDGMDEAEDAKFVNDDEDDEDPFFISTSAQRNKYHLGFSTDFVASAGINARKTITLKNVDGYEEVLRVRSQRGQSPGLRPGRPNRWRNYFLSAGWKEFQRKSNISEGDEFVFKFIRNEDKFCVAKITEKKTPAAEASVTEVVDGMDDNDVTDVELFENGYHDVDDDDGDPSFILTSTKKNRYHLPFSADFVALAEINTRKTITVKNLDGYEKVLRVRSQSRKYRIVQSRRNRLNGYYLASGWNEFQRNSNILEGDQFLFKFIRSEDKFCVAKITENITLNVDDNDVTDVDEDVELFDDGNPSFVATITPTYNHVLRMPTDFARLARLDTKKTLTLKSLDGYEKQMPLRVEKSEWTRYYVGSGWKDILQSTSISEGDKCVFKFIASEDKLCLVKIVKKKTQLPVEEAQDKDENEDVEPVDDVDPFFTVDITTSHNCMLRLPRDFVKSAGIDGKDKIIIKCVDGNETEMVLRPVKQGQSTRYCFSIGWPAFKRRNNISVGDECVFKYITREDKMSLAKNTKKITPRPKVDDNKDEDENVELVDDGIDDNKDEDKDAEFKVTITPSHKSKLRLPPDFVDLAGIDGKKNIIIKCPDGNERQMVLTPVKQGQSTRYSLSMGWSAFRRSNNISEGDECLFKYITSEDKICLAKITKKDGDANVERVNDGMDDNDVNEYVKLVDGMDDKDMEFNVNNDEDENENENVELVDDGMDDKDVDEYAKLVDGLVDDEDPFFRVTIGPSHKSMLRLPPDFVELAGINTKQTIIIKSLDGNESQMDVRFDGRLKSLRYHLSKGLAAFMRRNNISQGNECVFKYITSEDKMCLAEVVKRKRGRPPPAQITAAEGVKRKRGRPPLSSPRVAKDVKNKKGRIAI